MACSTSCGDAVLGDGASHEPSVSTDGDGPCSSKAARVWTVLADNGSLMVDVGIASSGNENVASGVEHDGRSREPFPLPLPSSFDDLAIRDVEECSVPDAVKFVRGFLSILNLL